MPFADDAEVPITWECKFDGTVARLVDGEEPEPKKAKPPRTHWDMLLERRSIAELEDILNERLESAPRPPRPRLLAFPDRHTEARDPVRTAGLVLSVIRITPGARRPHSVTITRRAAARRSPSMTRRPVRAGGRRGRGLGGRPYPGRGPS